ncbi:spermidine synthase [Crossiella cryophila]|uniref:Polyamine aminopropyltransferase n=1 Tax=Crossiella cryophila TaxID=43355 RepID=A0A7W7CAZ5_9PSEU|nr:spermidine synthase [Crossiella cryophila]MBB4677832.1 spermidine synthase [Crossiella cryophila]
MTSVVEATRVIREPMGPGLTRIWDVQDVLWEGDTAFQHVVIGRTEQGVSLFCDNDRQSTEYSQLTYHEALLVPGLLLAEKVKRVLVVGSSEGVVCQMSVAFGAEIVDHVDIDAECVKVCAANLPYGYTPAELAAAETHQGPVRVHYTDGWQYLLDAAADENLRYDIVLVDLPDEREEEAQHNRLYGEEFLGMCKAVLAPGGVVITQAGCQTMWRNNTLVRSWQRFNDTFGTVVYYGSDEHEWAYLFGRADAVAAPVEKMVERLKTSSYAPASIDAEALRGNSIPPYLVRKSYS